MRSSAVVAVVAVLVLLALPSGAVAKSGPTAVASAYHGCRGIVDAGPTGMDPADVKGLRARNISCNRARRVARQWLRPFGSRIRGRFKLFGRWKCADTTTRHTHVRCRARGGKRVRFYLG